MKNVLASLAALCVIGIAPSTWAATTYTISGATYSPGLILGTYTGQTGVTGSFTTAAPLPAGLNNAHIASGQTGLNYVTSWTFSDGLFTYTNANSAVAGNQGFNFAVTTNGNGDITDFTIDLSQPKTGAAVGQPAQELILSPTQVYAVDATCTFVVPATGLCQSMNLGSPIGQGQNQAASIAFAASAAPPPVASSTAPIPALSDCALILLGVLLAASGLLTGRRRET